MRVFSQTITVVSHFLLAMMLHPETQRKAQQELDSVVGTDRLPTFEDRERLPYGRRYSVLCIVFDANCALCMTVESIFKEVLRWGVPVPLSESLSFGFAFDFSF